MLPGFINFESPEVVSFEIGVVECFVTLQIQYDTFIKQD